MKVLLEVFFHEFHAFTDDITDQEMI